jgi:hypothetical protein
LGNLVGEDDIFDQNAFNGNTPFLDVKIRKSWTNCEDKTYVGYISNNFRNFEGDRLTLGDNALNRASTNNVTQGSLSTLSKRLAQIGDTECRAVRVRDLEVNYRVTAIGDMR